MARRPWNESDRDRAYQDAAKEVVAKRWRLQIETVHPPLYLCDWVTFRDSKLCGWAEYKHRDKPWGEYPTVYLSVAKWVWMMRMTERTGFRSVFVTEWTCGSMMWTVLEDRVDKIIWGGNGRGQEGDLEPVVPIPIDKFRRLV